MAPDQSLLDQAFDRLAEDSAPDDLVDLLLAAYVGDEQLAAVLGESPSSCRPVTRRRDRVHSRSTSSRSPSQGSEVSVHSRASDCSRMQGSLSSWVEMARASRARRRPLSWP